VSKRTCIEKTDAKLQDKFFHIHEIIKLLLRKPHDYCNHRCTIYWQNFQPRGTDMSDIKFNGI